MRKIHFLNLIKSFVLSKVRCLRLVYGYKLKANIGTRKEWWEGRKSGSVKERPFPGCQVGLLVTSLKNLFLVIKFPLQMNYLSSYKISLTLSHTHNLENFCNLGCDLAILAITLFAIASQTKCTNTGVLEFYFFNNLIFPTKLILMQTLSYQSHRSKSEKTKTAVICMLKHIYQVSFIYIYVFFKISF